MRAHLDAFLSIQHSSKNKISPTNHPRPWLSLPKFSYIYFFEIQSNYPIELERKRKTTLQIILALDLAFLS